jgi:hypothetical protein
MAVTNENGGKWKKVEGQDELLECTETKEKVRILVEDEPIKRSMKESTDVEKKETKESTLKPLVE